MPTTIGGKIFSNEMLHVVPGLQRRLDLRHFFKSCISLGLWSAPDGVLKILLWELLIYLKEEETLMLFCISLYHSLSLPSAVWSFDQYDWSNVFTSLFQWRQQSCFPWSVWWRLSLWEPRFGKYIQFTAEKTIFLSRMPKDIAMNTESSAVPNKIFMIQKNLWLAHFGTYMFVLELLQLLSKWGVMFVRISFYF